MTERTVRSVARELAGVFYEEAGADLFGTEPEDRARSARFRATYPTIKHYLKGMQVLPDGRIKPDKPGWMYFISLARARMVQILQDPSKKNLHDAIYKALLEENEKSTSPAAQELLQRRLANTPSIGSR